MRRVALASLLLFLTSCVGFQGNLVVNESFSVKEKKDVVVVPEGVYNAQLVVKSKRKLKLKIQNNTVDKSATIKLAKGFKLPEYDGDFEIPASVIDQSFKIVGHKQTVVTRTSPVTEHQSCSIRRVRRVCRKVCETKIIKLPNGRTERRRVCRNVCNDIVRYIPGSKLVTYHYKTVKQSLDLSLVDSDSLAQVADYQGGNTSTTQITDSIGYCNPLRY